MCIPFLLSLTLWSQQGYMGIQWVSNPEIFSVGGDILWIAEWEKYVAVYRTVKLLFSCWNHRVSSVFSTSASIPISRLFSIISWEIFYYIRLNIFTFTRISIQLIKHYMYDSISFYDIGIGILFSKCHKIKKNALILNVLNSLVTCVIPLYTVLYSNYPLPPLCLTIWCFFFLTLSAVCKLILVMKMLNV